MTHIHLFLFQHDQKEWKHYMRNQNEERQSNYMKCEKYFRKSPYVTRHKRINPKQKAYKCKDCGKSYTYHANFQTHQRIHTGEEPYRCQACGKSFTRHANLQAHHRIHTDENLTDVKNVASPLPGTQHFIIITESILVRNLTDVLY